MEKDDKIILGIDEAGRGPVLGPMVIAGVEMKKPLIKELREAGVRDSKLLSRSARARLYRKIKKLSENIYVMCMSPTEIDDMMNFMNLNRIELRIMAKIINASNASEVYIDLPSTGNRFVEELKSKLRKKVKLVAEHKADEKYPIVSAASIVAKVVREKEMDKLRKKYAAYGDIGSGYPADERTMKFLREYYSTQRKMPEETRMCWNTVKDIKNTFAQKKLFKTCSDESEE